MRTRIKADRERTLEDIYISGYAIMPKKKFNLLAGYENLYPGTCEIWLSAWREYMEDEDADLQILAFTDTVVLTRETNSNLVSTQLSEAASGRW